MIHAFVSNVYFVNLFILFCFNVNIPVLVDSYMNIYSHITSMTGLIKTKIIQIKIFILVDVHWYYPIVCKNNTCLTFILKNVRKLFKNEIRKIEDIFLWTFLHIKTFLCLASKNVICLIFFMHYSRDLEGKVYIRFSTVKDPQNALLLCRLSSKRQLPLVGITLRVRIRVNCALEFHLTYHGYSTEVDLHSR